MANGLKPVNVPQGGFKQEFGATAGRTAQWPNHAVDPALQIAAITGAIR